MSSLQRYKKTGGFLQLLSLIETFGPQKREKFLEMIETENRSWAKALREKMLSLERVFSWPDEHMTEVFKELPAKSLAYVLLGVKPEQKARVEKFLSQAEKRRVADALSENQPKAEEIASTLVKVVEIARRQIQEKILHVEKFDPQLTIPEDYENLLENQDLATLSGERADEELGAGEHGDLLIGDPTKASNLEMARLQRTCGLLVKENKALKTELQFLRDKLEQIKRIA